MNRWNTIQQDQHNMIANMALTLLWWLPVLLIVIPLRVILSIAMAQLKAGR